MPMESLGGLVMRYRMQLALVKLGVIEVVATRVTKSRSVICEQGSIEIERKPDGKLLLFFSGMGEVQSNPSEIVDTK